MGRAHGLSDVHSLGIGLKLKRIGKINSPKGSAMRVGVLGRAKTLTLAYFLGFVKGIKNPLYGVGILV